MEQLIAHLFGDYILQSHWMAQNKAHDSRVAIIHAGVYTLPFLALTRSIPALAVILLSHAAIDRWQLARYVVWAKNWLAPRKKWYASCAVSDWTDRLIEIHPNEVYEINQPMPPFWTCRTGYPPRTPEWLAIWLLIVADNTLHLAINYAALRWL